jgi:hypothetical protein
MIENCYFHWKFINNVPHKNPFPFPITTFFMALLSPNEVYRHKTLKGHYHAAPFFKDILHSKSICSPWHWVLKHKATAKPLHPEKKFFCVRYGFYWIFHTPTLMLLLLFNINQTPPTPQLMIDARSSRSHIYKRHEATNDCWAGWRRHKILFLFTP